MKRTFIFICISILLTQCIENESEHIIFPELISTEASIMSTSPSGLDRTFEIKGEFSRGQFPLEDIKIAYRSINTANRTNPKSLIILKSVDLQDGNTFMVELETSTAYTYYIAFYFVSDNGGIYSDTYSLSVVGNEVLFYKIFPIID
jgi:hypothetical protein